MITVGMNYQVLPGRDEQFTTAFAKVMKALEREPGHRESHLYRDVWSEHDYLIVSEWDDEVAFDEFIASDRFRKVADWGRENILAGRPQHRVYR